MERLTGRDAYGDIVANEEMQIIASRGTTYDDLHNIINHLAEKLYEYEDLEEQGRLVKLPCKVGNIVYCIENKEIYTCTVEKISISKNNGVWVEINFPKEMPDIVAIEYNLDDIGKTVFLAKSEAEAAMNKLKGKDNKDIERDIERD